jgi:hypothetical protein
MALRPLLQCDSSPLVRRRTHDNRSRSDIWVDLQDACAQRLVNAERHRRVAQIHATTRRVNEAKPIDAVLIKVSFALSHRSIAVPWFSRDGIPGRPPRVGRGNTRLDNVNLRAFDADKAARPHRATKNPFPPRRWPRRQWHDVEAIGVPRQDRSVGTTG